MSPFQCNLCGGNDWMDTDKSKAYRCKVCKSFARTRALKFILDSLGLPQADSRVLHFAPEYGLAKYLKSKTPNYLALDLDPDQYIEFDASSFDMATEMESLPTAYYDVIIHMHVLEHIRGYIAPIIHHLFRALKPTGYHIFSIPLEGGFYGVDFGPLSEHEAQHRFGQEDHVRRFTERDFSRHLGSLLKIKGRYSLYDYGSKEEIDRCNISEEDRQGLSGSTIFVNKRSDYRLVNFDYYNPPKDTNRFTFSDKSF